MPLSPPAPTLPAVGVAAARIEGDDRLDAQQKADRPVATYEITIEQSQANKEHQVEVKPSDDRQETSHELRPESPEDDVEMKGPEPPVQREPFELDELLSAPIALSGSECESDETCVESDSSTEEDSEGSEHDGPDEQLLDDDYDDEESERELREWSSGPAPDERDVVCPRFKLPGTKYQHFVNLRLHDLFEKPATEVPGIGPALGQRLTKQKINTV